MEVGAYTLHLYCDNEAAAMVPFGRDEATNFEHFYGEFPKEFVSNDRGGAVRKARRTGWIFKRDGTHLCPRCSGKVDLRRQE